MKLIVPVIALALSAVTVQSASASCQPKTFSTIGSSNYFYVFEPTTAASTFTSIVGRFWSPGSYASTGEQSCNESHWLGSCPGCAGGPVGHTWYVYGTLGAMSCTSGCPAGEMILTLEDKSADGQSAYFAAARVDETVAAPQFDFSRIGRNWDLVAIPKPRVLYSDSGDVFTAGFSVDDPAPGFYELPGASASGTITALRLYSSNQPTPREKSAWTYVGRYPYSGGVTTGRATLVCPPSLAVYIAVAVEFDSGEVVTDYVSSGEFVDCDPFTAGAGSVRDGGPGGLFVAHDANGDLSLSWGPSCSYMDQGYELYEGTIGDWTSHVPRSCATAGRTAIFAPPPGNAYYLVVPSEYEYEGSYGSATSGERPLGLSACRQRLVNLCPP